MRVLVCGGRNYKDMGAVINALSDLPVTHVIEGGARGADELARLWARDHGIPCTTFPAKWAEFGYSAGPIRNQQMIDEGKPDLVVAFPGGKGTANMLGKAKAAGIPIRQFEEFPATGSGAPAGLMAAQEK